jgi:hypothetical protein
MVWAVQYRYRVTGEFGSADDLPSMQFSRSAKSSSSSSGGNVDTRKKVRFAALQFVAVPMSVENLRLERCHFDNCYATADDTSRRPLFRNLELVGCSQRSCSLDGAILDEVVVDGLGTHGLFQIWGCAFKHVTLRGRVGRIMLSNLVSPLPEDRELAREFEEANRIFHKSVDWALDIRDLDCDECDIRCLPGALVRRNPETQAAVSRETALRLKPKWEAIDFTGSSWRMGLELMLSQGYSDSIFAVGRPKKTLPRELEVLAELRRLGVAE